MALGIVQQGKEKSWKRQKGQTQSLTEHCSSYSNSFKNYQVGTSKQNIDANEEAAEPCLPPVVNTKAKLDSWCFLSVPFSAWKGL